MDDPGWVGLSDALARHEDLWIGLGLGSGLLFLGSLLALPWLVAKIPADHFRHHREPIHHRWIRHPLGRALLQLARNLVGLLLVVAGILMLFLPGQGLLTVLLGLMVMHFPGKYRLERWVIGRRGVLRAMNWLRRRRGVAALMAPERS